MEFQKVLITGGSGFLGSHLADIFIEKGAEVYSVDDVSTGSLSKIDHLLKNNRFHFYQDSILNASLIEMLVKKCDMVFHFAAVVGVELYLTNPKKVIDVNVDGTKNILESANRHHKKTFLASTSEVYGKNPDVPWNEEADRVLGTTTKDRWVYATTKALNEHLALAYHSFSGLPVVIFRFFNTYGPRIDEPGSGRVISIFIEQALKNKPITIIGDGSQTRCFTYVDDVIDGIMASVGNPRAVGQVFNLGRPDETPIVDLAKLLKKISSSQSEIVFVEETDIYTKTNYEDVPRRVPNIDKARRILGFNPTTGIEEGFGKTISWFKGNYNL